jgi:hypothetical protein
MIDQGKIIGKIGIDNTAPNRYDRAPVSVRPAITHIHSAVSDMMT